LTESRLVSRVNTTPPTNICRTKTAVDMAAVVGETSQIIRSEKIKTEYPKTMRIVVSEFTESTGKNSTIRRLWVGFKRG
ncbi:MAG: hypothetical protein ACKPAJ_11415, partial [Actinomycetota bacterium]